MLIGTLSASVPPHPRGADDVIVDRMMEVTPHMMTESESSIEGQSELVPNPTGIGIDRLSDFHIQSGIVDRSWICSLAHQRIAVHLGSHRTIRCTQLAVIARRLEASQARHCPSWGSVLLNLTAMATHCACSSMFVSTFLSHSSVCLDSCFKIFGQSWQRISWH